MRLSWLVLVFAFTLTVTADEVTATPAAATAPVVTKPIYKSWNLSNDLVEVVVSELQGSIRSISLINERPIRLRDWQAQELLKQKIALPDPDKPLAVLDDFNPGSGKHNWIGGVELPSAASAAPWSATQSDPRHLRLEYADPAKGLRWADIGCGNGAFTELLAKRCAPAAVEGIDPSEGQIAYARTRGRTGADGARREPLGSELQR